MNIYEKWSWIMEQVQYLKKDDNIKFGSTNYKALSEEKVTATVRQFLVQQKLIILPVSQTAHKEGQITSVDVVYRVINTENPEEWFDIVSSGQGADTQDKGVGKAMTYAYKYMLLRSLAIPTGEDPDKISSEELDHIFEEEKKAKKAESKKAETKAEKNDAESYVYIPTDADRNKIALTDQVSQLRGIIAMKMPEDKKGMEDFIDELYKKDTLDKLTRIQAYTAITSFDKFLERYEG